MKISNELSGDQYHGDDEAIMAGIGYLDGVKVAVIGIEKGRKTKEKIKRNFGMPRPEGYRKAKRVMEMASRFNLPIISFVDTPGAYPGIGAEERGQSRAIADNIEQMFTFKTPIISVIIGEGGSGGALGIAIADRVLMMEFSIYSVISPESCASILWADPKKAEHAATSLKLGPQQAMDLKIIDGIIPEPAGGAHRHFSLASDNIKSVLLEELKVLMKVPKEEMKKARYNKFREMGNMTLKKQGPEEQKM